MNPNSAIRRKPFFIAAMLLAASGLAACSHTKIQEERYGDGGRKSRTPFLLTSEDSMLRHGIRMSWYPSGEREAMETYVEGYQQGYAFRWYPDGRMKSIEHYTDGMRDGMARYWDDAGNLIAAYEPGSGYHAHSSAAETALSSRLAARP